MKGILNGRQKSSRVSMRPRDSRGNYIIYIENSPIWDKADIQNQSGFHHRILRLPKTDKCIAFNDLKNQLAYFG